MLKTILVYVVEVLVAYAMRSPSFDKRKFLFAMLSSVPKENEDDLQYVIGHRQVTMIDWELVPFSFERMWYEKK